MGNAAPVVCVLPWIHTLVNVHGWTRACAVSGCGESIQPSTGCVKDTSVFDIVRGPKTAAIREAMLSGTWPKDCEYCRKREAIGMPSFRQELNKRFPHHYEALLAGKLEPGLRTLDVRLSNRCNFKCRMCSGWPSTRWRQDHALVFPTDPVPERVLSIKDVETFWSDLKTVAPKLEGLHVAGGETLVMPEFYELLDMLLASGNDSLILSFDTNLSTLGLGSHDLVSMLKRFRRLIICLSLEGVGRKGEYIRHGLEYERWLANARRLMQELPHARRQMHFTISLFNALDLRHHYDEIMQIGVVPPHEIEFTFVEWPPYLNIKCFTPELKELLERRLSDMIDSDPFVTPRIAERLRSIVAFARAEHLHPELGKEFARITEILDRERGENVHATFPELESMFR